MRRIIVNLLATFGALVLFGTVVTWGFRRYVNGDGGIFVTREGNRPVVGAPVYLDRGDGIIERYVTDSQGRFTFPKRQAELSRIKWLICAPGSMPMVGSANGDLPLRMSFGTSPQPAGRPAMYRGFGWLGPIPRECPPVSDSVGWRFPAESGLGPDRMTYVEPDWNSYSRRK